MARTPRLFEAARDMSWSGISFITSLEHLCNKHPEAEDFDAARALVEIGIRRRTPGISRLLDEFGKMNDVNEHLDLYGCDDFDYGDMQPEENEGLPAAVVPLTH